MPRRRRKLTPPAKPYADFPLTPHSSGKFQKAVRLPDGSRAIKYFGAWAVREDKELVPVADGGWKQALEEWEEFKAKHEQLLKGAELVREKAAIKSHIEEAKRLAEEEAENKQLQAEADSNALSLGRLCNLFLDVKETAVKNGKLAASTYTDYKQSTNLLVKTFGPKRIVQTLEPLDFQQLRSSMDEKWKSPDRIAKFITTVRSVFKYADESNLIERSISFGPIFKKPTAKEFRKHRAAGGKRMFTPKEIIELLDGRNEKGELIHGAGDQLRAMILLGINCGFGNTDCGTLPITAVDLKGAMIEFPRPKTGIERHCPLWPETIAVLRKVIATRKSGTVFVTEFGNPWVNGTTDSVSREFTKVLKRLHINGRRSLGFYSLRHTFDTIGMEVNDRDAVKSLMGHTDPEMVARYNHGLVPLARRQAVVNHVRQWLFGKAKKR